MAHPIPQLEKPQRLDLYLTQLYPQTSRDYWREHLESTIRLDGKRARKGDLVRGGESLEILAEPQLGPQFLQANPELPLQVVYEDEDLLALNKPAGLHCIPLQTSETNTLVNALLARYPEQRAMEDRLDCGLLQRLDEETSGLVLVARHLKIKAAYLKEQAQSQVIKEYLAWVEGKPSLQEGRIKIPLAHDSREAKKMLAAAEPDQAQKLKARPALTEWQYLKTQGAASLLRLALQKGQRHQLRVHLAWLGHPILGDKLYGGRPAGRLLLHAKTIRLPHPRTGKPLELQAQAPEDFKPSSPP